MFLIYRLSKYYSGAYHHFSYTPYLFKYAARSRELVDSTKNVGSDFLLVYTHVSLGVSVFGCVLPAHFSPQGTWDVSPLRRRSLSLFLWTSVDVSENLNMRTTACIYSVFPTSISVICSRFCSTFYTCLNVVHCASLCVLCGVIVFSFSKQLHCVVLDVFISYKHQNLLINLGHVMRLTLIASGEHVCN